MLLIILMPVLNILRYDTASKELIVLGNVWSLGLKYGFYADRSIAGSFHIASQFFLKAILPWLFILSIFPLLGYFTGRFFCGWLCPEGALFELGDYFTLKLKGRRSLYANKPNDPDVKTCNRLSYSTLAVLCVMLIPLIGGVALTGYFVAPKTIWNQIINWNFTFGVKAGIIGVAIYMLTTSIFVRHVLCRFVCAAGLMQMLLGWVSPVSLRLKMDTTRIAECTDCKGCEKVCFMSVIPRRNKHDISCVNCGVCIDSCNKELGLGNGLLHYSFGRGSILPEDKCIGGNADSLITYLQGRQNPPRVLKGGVYGSARSQEANKIFS